MPFSASPFKAPDVSGVVATSSSLKGCANVDLATAGKSSGRLPAGDENRLSDPCVVTDTGILPSPRGAVPRPVYSHRRRRRPSRKRVGTEQRDHGVDARRRLLLGTTL